MYSDAAGTIPVLTSDTTDGFAFTVNVNLDGSTTATNYSDQTNVESPSSAVPEPNNLLLVATGLTILGVMSWQWRPLMGK
jgi:hypothetical protein